MGGTCGGTEVASPLISLSKRQKGSKKTKQATHIQRHTHPLKGYLHAQRQTHTHAYTHTAHAHTGQVEQAQRHSERHGGSANQRQELVLKTTAEAENKNQQHI